MIDEIIERGNEVVYMHPEAEKIDGHPAQPNLLAVKNQVECVFVSLIAERDEMVLHEVAIRA